MQIISVLFCTTSDYQLIYSKRRRTKHQNTSKYVTRPQHLIPLCQTKMARMSICSLETQEITRDKKKKKNTLPTERRSRDDNIRLSDEVRDENYSLFADKCTLIQDIKNKLAGEKKRQTIWQLSASLSGEDTHKYLYISGCIHRYLYTYVNIPVYIETFGITRPPKKVKTESLIDSGGGYIFYENFRRHPVY